MCRHLPPSTLSEFDPSDAMIEEKISSPSFTCCSTQRAHIKINRCTEKGINISNIKKDMHVCVTLRLKYRKAPHRSSRHTTEGTNRTLKVLGWLKVLQTSLKNRNFQGWVSVQAWLRRERGRDCSGEHWPETQWMRHNGFASQLQAILAPLLLSGSKAFVGPCEQKIIWLGGCACRATCPDSGTRNHQSLWHHKQQTSQDRVLCLTSTLWNLRLKGPK